jgi:Lectin C-type domain
VYPSYGTGDTDWYTARNKCLSLKGDLATDVADEENLTDFAQRLQLSSEFSYWIGLQKDPWTWTDTENGKFVA